MMIWLAADRHCEADSQEMKWPAAGRQAASRATVRAKPSRRRRRPAFEGEFILLASIAVALGGCNFAPTDPPPAPPSAVSFKEADGWKQARPADALPRGAWWKIFSDSDLDRLEQALEQNNQTLRQALALHDQAAAAARIAGSSQFPQASYALSANRDQRSRDAAVQVHPPLYNDILGQVSLSWEVDLWGRVRNLVAGAAERSNASAADLAASKLALEGELASAYLTLQSLDSQQEILDRTVVADQQALDFTIHRHEGGVAAQVDVDQAELQVANARTVSSNNRLLRAQQEHAIAIMVGEVPANFALAARALRATPPAIDCGLPSSLLERRPDIAAAERRVAAANADIGVARAAFFPVFDLAALGGLESGVADRLLNSASKLWAIGPQATGPLFDGGARSAAVDQARAAYEQAGAAYRQTVLTAYREVEDNLTALRRLEEESFSQEVALSAARRALQQAQTRYKGGLATYLEVISAQNAALAAEIGAIDVQSRRMLAAVGLIQALGGGWEGVQTAAALPN
jgi:NodT family efflux transporter outer membrane factor (OMF) lipoprotein